MLNISGTRVVEDINFRYKMPRMIAKTEGRGNGIKTVIVNMSDIATALNRPPELVTKFFVRAAPAPGLSRRGGARARSLAPCRLPPPLPPPPPPPLILPLPRRRSRCLPSDHRSSPSSLLSRASTSARRASSTTRTRSAP